MSTLSNPDRLAALAATGLPDSPSEEAFDRLTRLVQRCVGVPVALVSLVGADRQFFKSHQGLPEPWCSMRETPLSHSFCQHVVTRDAPLVIEDARRDPLVRDSLAIPDLNVIAYLGVPLRTPDGHVLGSLCAIDGRPRAWTDGDLEAVEALAESAMAEIATRWRLGAETNGLWEAVERSRAIVKALFEDGRARAVVTGAHVTEANGALLDLLGRTRDVVVGKTLAGALGLEDGDAGRLADGLIDAEMGERPRVMVSDGDLEVALVAVPLARQVLVEVEQV